MSQGGFKRKLAAILSADVVGYSLLIESDSGRSTEMVRSYALIHNFYSYPKPHGTVLNIGAIILE
jgi:hypothetical protein